MLKVLTSYVPYRLTLILWAGLMLLLLPVLTYVAYHPSVLLWVEAAQPAQGYANAQKLMRQGKVDQAIAELQKAIAFWDELYAQHGLDSHRVQLALCLCGMATIYAKHGTHQQLQKALELYERGLTLYPSQSKGNAWLEYGRALAKLKRYKAALTAFERAIGYRFAPIALMAVFERGHVHVQLGQPQKAAQDWSTWLRFVDSIDTIPTELLAGLPPCETASCALIQAVLAYRGGDAQPSRERLRQIPPNEPNHTFAAYWRAQLTGEPFPHDEGIIPLDERIFPASEDGVYPIQHAYVNLYIDRPGEYALTLELALANEDLAAPELAVSVDQSGGVSAVGGKTQKILVTQAKKTAHTVRLPWRRGKNRLVLQIDQSTVSEQDPPVLLHSMQLKRQQAARQ